MPPLVVCAGYLPDGTISGNRIRRIKWRFWLNGWPGKRLSYRALIR